MFLMFFLMIGKGQSEIPELHIFRAGEKQADKCRMPSLELFLLADDEPRPAVLICPGGGYTYLSYEKEGTRFARWFNEQGMNAFVLRYRHDSRDCPEQKYYYPAPQLDASQALRYIRKNAAKLSVNPDKIGIMGFSAGGHLASTIATLHGQWDHFFDVPDKDVSDRPDFSILIYPVISFANERLVHKGSRYHLLGEKEYQNKELHQQLSTERHVDSTTPPTFLLHADNDHVVPPGNSIDFYSAMKSAGVKGEMHIYGTGGHGFGMADKTPSLSSWTNQLRSWLIFIGAID